MEKRKTDGRFSTLADVAAMAGVSASVAGAVINGTRSRNSRAGAATQERVLEAARQLRGGLTGTYGVLVASAGDPLRSFLIQHLDTQLVELGQHTIICNTVDDRDRGGRFLAEVDSLEHRRVDGVFCAVHPWWPGDRKALLKRHPPTVFYEDPSIPGAAVVAPDRDAAVRLGLRHLVGRGRRRIPGTRGRPCGSNRDWCSGVRREGAFHGAGCLSDLPASGIVGHRRRRFGQGSPIKRCCQLWGKATDPVQGFPCVDGVIAVFALRWERFLARSGDGIVGKQVGSLETTRSHTEAKATGRPACAGVAG